MGNQQERRHGKPGQPAAVSRAGTSFRQPAAHGHPLIQLQRTIGNQAVCQLTRSTGRPEAAGGGASRNVIQRVVGINGEAVLPGRHGELIAKCIQLAGEQSLTWGDSYSIVLKQMLEDRHNRYMVKQFSELHGIIEDAVKNGKPPTGTPITDDELKGGHKLRSIERVGKLMELSSQQISLDVPGVSNVDKKQLLPLDHHWEDQQQRWQKNHRGQLNMLKRKGEAMESEVSAYGNPEDPSMVYYRDDRQLGHRYKGIPNDDQYAYHHSNDRTYGGKSNTDTGIYKVTKMVDGHGIQAQNDQATLGPRKFTYPTADRDPHNMYWENNSYGPHARQGGFENKAFENQSVFLHVNEYTDYDNPTMVTPHKGKSDLSFDVVAPDRVHNLIEQPDHSFQYAEFNNSRMANYNDFDYRQNNSDYKIETSLSNIMARGGLGGYKAEDHIEENTHPTTDDFPYAQVIDIHGDDDWEFDPIWKKDISGYESPPPSPYYQSEFLEEEQTTLPGHHFEGENLPDGRFVVKADHRVKDRKKRLKKARMNDKVEQKFQKSYRTVLKKRKMKSRIHTKKLKRKAVLTDFN